MLQAVAFTDGELYFDSGFLSITEADDALSVLTAELAWHQPQVMLFGRRVTSPRLAAWYGDPGAVYTYSGQVNEPLSWTPALKALRQRVAAAAGAKFNSVLANRYRDGADSMGWHRDAEPELGRNPVIASVSLGATRRFVLRHKKKKSVAPVVIELTHGSLLVMAGATQHYWRHRVPPTRRPVAARINLTFRYVLPASAQSAP